MITHRERYHAATRIELNIALISVATASFFFIGAVRPSLLMENTLFTLQLVCAIPLLLGSAIAARRIEETHAPTVYRTYSTALFVIGYAFIINTVGIMVALLSSVYVGLIFFALNIVTPVMYSFYRVHYDGDDIASRLRKDGLFIVILIFLGAAIIL